MFKKLSEPWLFRSNKLIYCTVNGNLFYVLLNNKKTEQTTTAIWLIKLIDQSLLFIPDGLTPKNLDLFFIKEKINLDKHQPQHLFAFFFQLTKNNGKKIEVVATPNLVLTGIVLK